MKFGDFLDEHDCSMPEFIGGAICGIGGFTFVRRVAKWVKPESRFIIGDVGMVAFELLVAEKAFELGLDFLHGTKYGRNKKYEPKNSNDDGIKEEEVEDGDE